MCPIVGEATKLNSFPVGRALGSLRQHGQLNRCKGLRCPYKPGLLRLDPLLALALALPTLGTEACKAQGGPGADGCWASLSERIGGKDYSENQVSCSNTPQPSPRWCALDVFGVSSHYPQA